MGGDGVGGAGGEPIQVNPSITAQLLRRRTAGRQRSEWFGIEMEERQSYSSSAQHPLLLAGNLDKVDCPVFFFPLPNPLPSSTHRLREAFKLSRLLQLRGCISVRSVSCGVFFLVTHVYLGCPALKDASINRTYNGSKWMKKKSHSLSSRRLSFCGKPAFRIRANSVGYPELECSPQGWACPNKWQGI